MDSYVGSETEDKQKLYYSLIDAAVIHDGFPENIINILVMAGVEDKPRPPIEAQEMAKLIGCACVEIPNAGHIANLENLSFTNEKLSKFVFHATS